VRTALYCLLWARKTKGQYLLRIEDTDRKRSSESAARGIIDDLAWLALAWDEGPRVGGDHGPYFQSQRLDLYNQIIDQLLVEGKAYPAWETREELGLMRRLAESEKRAFRYRRVVYSDDDLARFEREQRVPTIRLVAPDHPITVPDGVLGDITMTTDELDDIVIRKGDGFPTYHFAVVVDDHHMGIDLILRGQEHMMNTHKHWGICEALGWTPVATAHLPIIFNPRGSKMSKRDKAKAARRAARAVSKSHPAGWSWLANLTGRGEAELDLFMRKKNEDLGIARAIADGLGVELPMVEVMDFRRGGYLPEALVNYLSLLGWSPGDDRQILSMEDLVESFTIDRITKTPARFDLDKLRWLNGEYLRNQLSLEKILDHLEVWLQLVDSPLRRATRSQLGQLLEMYRPRILTFADLNASALFFFEAPTSYAPKAVKKHLLKEGGLERLVQMKAALADVGRWEADSLERAMDTLVEMTGAKLGKFAQPLRVALSGTAVTPGIYEVLAWLGRDEALDRIQACLDSLDQDLSTLQ
jgi:glutamyl-tRNA synthetase